MFCNNCGSQINPESKFCKNCGTPVPNPAGNVQSSRSNYPGQNVQEPPEPTTENPYPPITEEIISEAPVAVPGKKKGIGVAAVFNIILGVIVVLLIGAIVFLVVTRSDDDYYTFGNNDEEEKQEQKQEETVLKLEVDSVSDSTEAFSYTLSGTISTSDDDANLSINGQNVTTVTEDDGKHKWSKDVLLENGENTFEIILYDKNGNSETKTVKIEHKTPLRFPRGTILVKGDESGVFVRPDHEISDTAIRYIEASDYTSQFVCQGEEYLDENNFIWCKVKTPEGAIGWVRSDLMWDISQ